MPEGYILHRGHGGLPCPDLGKQKGAEDVNYPKCVTLVAINGFFEHHIQWCSCHADGYTMSSPMQLFQEHFFPATHVRPETALLLTCWIVRTRLSTDCKRSNSNGLD